MNNGCIQMMVMCSLLLMMSRQTSGEKKCLKEQPNCICTYRRVDCSDKQIDVIPASFPNTTKQIYLNRNNITFVKRGTFHGLTTLTSINLFKNNISYMESDAFYNLSLLEEIVLKNNSLQEILPKTFHALKTLSDIYLQNNKIAFINTEAFVELPKLRSIYLDGNNIHCTCAVSWFVQYLGKHPMVSQRSPTRCAYPPYLAGTDITRLNTGNLQCDSNSSIALRKEIDSTPSPYFYVALGLVSGVLISTVFILLLRKRECRIFKPSRHPAAATQQGGNASDVFVISDQMVLTSTMRELRESSVDNVAYHSSASVLYEPMWSGDRAWSGDGTWSADGYTNGSLILKNASCDYQDVANTCTDTSGKLDQKPFYRRPTV